MHELSLCESIRDVVLTAAQGRPVTGVTVRIGRLRQVVPESLLFCWDAIRHESARGDGLLADAEMAIEEVPVTLACANCGKQTLVEDDLAMLCPGCFATAVEPVTGTECLVLTVDVREAGADRAGIADHAAAGAGMGS
ncbi:MAG: hydrogenase maturation nickel metallochaperone HypA [Austwickia sp.]|jgi:hydrogenase nickel incorporation protein HypA/HybF|nr:MAG: hydrogenase maturation nickel metallochaperone HypA [Austwickia sp.]